MGKGQGAVPAAVQAILTRLRGAGFEVYIVGGAVRDMVMGRAPSDWDFATSASSGEVGDLFPELTRFSLQHGTITLMHEGRAHEVTTFRGASSNLEEDLAHRDFTINAMAWGAEQARLIDPFGGRRDLALRLLRAVGDPEGRFREDPLRLLRAVRISCELGFRIHPETFAAMHRMVHLLEEVAKERIRDELVRLLTGQTPSPGLRQLADTGMLAVLLPELPAEAFGKGKRLETVTETVERVSPDPVLRLSAFFQGILGQNAGEAFEAAGPRIAENALRRLRFSERMVFQVAHMLLHCHWVMQYDRSWGEGAVRRMVQRVGAEHLDPLFSLCRAALQVQGKQPDLLSELEQRARQNLQAGFPVRIEDLKIDGRMVMEILQVQPGREVGRILGVLLEEVLDHPDWNTESRLLERLREMRGEG